MHDDLLYTRALMRDRRDDLERRRLIREAEQPVGDSREAGTKLPSRVEFWSPDGRRSSVKRAA